MTITSPNLRGIICMVLACLFFVCCDSFLKLILLELPPLQALVVRGVFASLWCLVLLAGLGLLKDIKKALGFWTLARAFCEVISVTAFIFALANIPLAEISAIYQTAPLIVLAGASVIWHEKVGAARWVLISLGMVGALVVAQPGGATSSPYALLGLITAFASASRDLLSRHVPDDTPGPVITLTVVVMVMMSAAVCSLLFETWAPVSTQVWFYAAAAGFFVMLAHLCMFLAFRFATARAVAPFYYCITIGAAVFGAVFFNEWPNTLAWVGIAMIVACGLGVLLMENRGEAK